MSILNKNQEELNNTWKWNSPPFFARFYHEARELLALDLGGDHSVLKLSTLTKSGDILRSTFYCDPQRSGAILDAHFSFKTACFQSQFNTISNKTNADIYLSKQFGKTSDVGVLLSVPYKSCSRLFVSSFQRHSTFTVVADRYPYHNNVTLEASLGTKSVALGGRLKYTPSSKSLLPMEIGIEARMPRVTATTLIDLVEKSVRSTFVHRVDKNEKLSAVVEVCQFTRTNEYSFTAGGEWSIDKLLTVLKATIDRNKTLKAYVRHRLKDRNVLVEISGTFDKRPKFFLSVEVVP